MNTKSRKLLLVGDNPFHNISHLSQERSRARGGSSALPEHAASLVIESVSNGANGFMFSVSETTLSILRIIRSMGRIENLDLYPIVPYAYEYVRLAAQSGGIPGLAKNFAKQLLLSRNLGAVVSGLKGFIEADLEALMESYFSYELTRTRSSAGRHAHICSLLLHQLITDMALALKLEWFFRSYVRFLQKAGITPGFNTGNFVYLVNKFREWDLDLDRIVIAAPFNKAGFQMNPSKEECEKILANIPPVVIAISVFAAGYLSPLEAISYIATLPNIKGVAVGVSKERHARETFAILSQKLS